MHLEEKDHLKDYRVNFLSDNSIISIEVTCCGRHIGEIRFQDGEKIKCPQCGVVHKVILQHNHFHIRPEQPKS